MNVRGLRVRARVQWRRRVCCRVLSLNVAGLVRVGIRVLGQLALFECLAVVVNDTLCIGDDLFSMRLHIHRVKFRIFLGDTSLPSTRKPPPNEKDHGGALSLDHQ